ncbi:MULTISPECIES: hypothetical protein [Nitrosomonas]|uniref:Membrane-associated protein n=1 Tax=Nitrosomonas communis TaxID=44574 RepID=A0A0F7KFN3_9PROT|nr:MULTISPECIES: hypothetical protein [Nitrosomonas]AKH37632.1 hypothetical protein AAW31_07155 [Nitrosomonas communis]TYP74445.1 hypothetical protein BCL69_108813 [Nitrosomonas communis]UVS62928.1 hypothetical protein NX761_07465 [Nitrosomonas sp. PLL12]SDX23422.1 hypothetical protein SAMN05421882_11081 [Nitrosomonas communis]
MNKTRIPLWLKWTYSLMVLIIVPVYWHDLGPANFLWFSDIALIVMVPALWLESRFLASTMAVGVLLLELMWVMDFIAGGNLTQIAAYMFNSETDWHIRILSGTFHLFLPPILLLMLLRYGYDRRALPAQIALAVIVVPVTYLVTDPSENINWVYGPAQRQDWISPFWYLVLLLFAFVFLVYLPSHWVFKRFFPVR